MRPILPVIALLLLATPALAADDSRQLVTMPDLPRSLMRADMLDHTAAISEIINYLAQAKYAAAAEIAERRIGRATMGRHAGVARGQGPGRFMPDTMHQMGFNMHDAADEFAKVAKTGDQTKSLAALHQLTASCVACHMAYRTR